MRRFFVICPIGFEDLTVEEIREKWAKLNFIFAHHHAQPQFDITKGGVEFDAPLDMGLYLNYLLKIPSRILLRLTQDQCKSFDELEHFFKKTNFTSYCLNKSCYVKISAAKSKINNEKRIYQSLQKVWDKKLNIALAKEGDNPQVFIRMHEDLCQVSIDTSGEHLHFRGYRAEQGVAPLRENFAAALLRLMIFDRSRDELRNITLIDPLCGSGTFLFEASQLFESQSQMRKFAFEAWEPIDNKKIQKNDLMVFKQYNGADSDEQVLAIAQTIHKQYFSALNYSFEKQDIFKAQSKDNGRNFVICNPPYGERLALSMNGREYYSELSSQLVSVYSCERLGLIIPDRFVKSFRCPANYKTTKTLRFLNNGVPVSFYMLDRMK